MLAYVSGFALGLAPVLRRQNKTFMQALRLIWVCQAVSIGMMEVAIAVPAGFLAAWR